MPNRHGSRRLRVAHEASELGAHASVQTVLSRAVVTAKTASAHHPVLLHRSRRIPTGAAAAATGG